MKLYYSSFSPFARKVRMSALVLGLDHELELIPIDVLSKDRSYEKINPLKKVPALVTREEKILVNSPFICEYLDSLSLGRKIIPMGPEKWDVLQIQAIADGVTDALVLRRYESLRAPDRIDPAYDQRQKNKIEEGLVYLEKNLPQLLGEFNLGSISVLATLGYLELRFSHEKRLESVPRLKDWFQSHQTWAPFEQTKP